MLNKVLFPGSQLKVLVSFMPLDFLTFKCTPTKGFSYELSANHYFTMQLFSPLRKMYLNSKNRCGV